MDFLHVTPEELLLDSFRLGRKVYEAGYRPKYSLSVWRGGTQVGLGVNAFFRNRGVQIYHSTIATESYTAPGSSKEVIVKGLDHLLRVVCREDSLLIVDDVFERGETVKAVVQTIRERARANAPKDIRVATVHRKPNRAVWTDVPVISLRDVADDVWIDYPHELADLISPEADDPLIRRKDPAISSLLKESSFPQEELVAPGPYLYVSAREILLDSIRLGINIVNDGFHPDFLIAMWPGGISVGLPVHEVYKYKVKKQKLDIRLPDHISLNTAHSFKYNQKEILGLEYLVDRINRTDNVLIIDSTFKGGKLVNAAFEQMKALLRRNLDQSRVRVASLYWNPDDNSTWTSQPVFAKPDYYLKKINVPVIYPHNVHRLLDPMKELETLNPGLRSIIYE